MDHLADGPLLEALPRIAARDRTTAAELLAHLAEVGSRRLFAAAGHSSMHAYCVGKLLYSDDAAEKRSHAARIAQAHPVLFEMLADGRMSLTTVRALGPHLGNGDAADLIAAAASRSRSEIERLLAERYPCRKMFEWGTAGSSAHTDTGNLPAPGRVGPSDSADPATTLAPSHASSSETPLAGERVALQLVIARATHAKLTRAKELLDFAVAANDPRHIPSTVREQVAARDAEKCAFVRDDGQRCESRHGLEFDHIAGRHAHAGVPEGRCRDRTGVRGRAAALDDRAGASGADPPAPRRTRPRAHRGPGSQPVTEAPHSHCTRTPWRSSAVVMAV